MDSAEISKRFAHHPPRNGDREAQHIRVRAACAALAHDLNDMLPEGREVSLALTNLEQVMYWANAAVARAPYPFTDDNG